MPPPSPAAHAVSFGLLASGDVSDYSSTIVNAIEAKIASTAGVDAGSVEVEVSAGSVVIKVTIRANTQADAQAAGAAVAADVADASKATAFLAAVPGISITVKAITPVAAGVVADAAMINQLNSSTSGLTGGAIAGIAVGISALVAIIVAVLYCRKKHTSVKSTASDHGTEIKC